MVLKLRQLKKTGRLIMGMLATAVALSSPAAQAQGSIQTLQDFNNTLLPYGESWKAGSNIYYPSLYVGFAPKAETASRIDFHLGRGNQARLTVVLDELTIMSYLYNLKARAELFSTAIKQGAIAPVQQNRLTGFNAILNSDTYQINQTIAAFESKQITREAFYQKSLAILKALNPGRIFEISTNLHTTFNRWKSAELASLKAKSGASSSEALKSYIQSHAQEAVITVNAMLMGRVNVTSLSDSQAKDLAELAFLSDESSFITKSAALLNNLTAGKYDYTIVTQNLQSRKALECASSQACTLVRSEFTAIYPVGSVRAAAKDREGNSIPMIREAGAMNFVSTGYYDVDQIRMEGYYGWVPKMNYTTTGNAIHNPAVRTQLRQEKYKFLYAQMNIPATHDHLWVVSRGAVSHGCTRMSIGHLLEVRQIFPSNPAEMKKLVYSGNISADYDLFDIDGSGSLKVMGVQYYLSYAIAGETGDGYREANGFSGQSFDRTKFYDALFGDRQYTISNGKYIFHDPYMTYFVGALKPDRAKPFSIKVPGDYELYEQAYEKDKIQFVDLPGLKISSLAANPNNNTNKSAQLMRLFGRVTACGPMASDKACNEAGYKQELQKLGLK